MRSVLRALGTLGILASALAAGAICAGRGAGKSGATGTGGTATTSYGASIYNVHIGGGGVFDATGNYFNGNIDEVC